MTDTPETDAAERESIAAYIENCGEDAVFPCDGYDFARKLERERDEWVAKAAELSAERESNAMQALAFKAERDGARRLAEKFASGHDVIFYWQNATAHAPTPETPNDDE